jgi:hypothetical protein
VRDVRDFRSEKMETADGKGIARARRQAEGGRFGRPGRTVLNRLLRRITASQVADLVGFWTMWHLHGGFEGLEELGMSRSTIFSRVRRFRTLFGKHPDEYQLPGVLLDVHAYWSAVASERGE